MNGKRREERVEVIVVDMKNGLVGITLWYFRLICVMLMHLSYFFVSDKAFFVVFEVFCLFFFSFSFSQHFFLLNFFQYW